ncbi:MAG TPA: ABC transporter, partial [Salinimicrobium sp.]|nr:ABC transporter [Salinimicrobium sp.]
MKELKHVNKYFLKYKWHLILGTFITVLARLFSLVTPRLIRESTAAIENYVLGETTEISEVRSELITNILLILGATLIAAIFTFLMRQTFIVVSRHIEYDLKNEIYCKYQDL